MAESLENIVREQMDQKLRKAKVKAAYPAPELGPNVWTVIIVKHGKSFIGRMYLEEKDSYRPKENDLIDVREPLNTDEQKPVKKKIFVVKRSNSEDPLHDEHKKELKKPGVKPEDIAKRPPKEVPKKEEEV